MHRLKTPHFNVSIYESGNPSAQKVALVLPGFLDSKDYAHIRSHVDFLATLGYYAMAIDMPGTWESGGDIIDYSFTNCLLAVTELIEKLNRPTIIVGHSNGGRLSLFAALKSPTVTGVIAMMSPLYTVRSTSKKQRLVQWKAEGVRHYEMDIPTKPGQVKRMTVPFSFIEDSEKYQLSKVISKVTIPKLFIAGSQDHVITKTEIKKSYEYATPPKQFKIVEAGHIYRHDVKAITEVNKLIAAFLKSYL